jgi:hypothetical protein
MAATVGIMRFTTRSLFVPKILVSALLIKGFLWALSTIRADSLFYAMTRATGAPAQAYKKDRPGRRAAGGGEDAFQAFSREFSLYVYTRAPRFVWLFRQEKPHLANLGRTR